MSNLTEVLKLVIYSWSLFMAERLEIRALRSFSLSPEFINFNTEAANNS